MPDIVLTSVHTHAHAHKYIYPHVHVHILNTHTKKSNNKKIASGDVEILGCVWTVGGAVKCIAGMVMYTFCSMLSSQRIRIVLRLSNSTSRFASKKD